MTEIFELNVHVMRNYLGHVG